MASQFQRLVYATKAAEVFYGLGSFDTVSYAKAPSSWTLGDYDLGVTIDLTKPYLNAGWAAGDRFAGVERIVGSQHSDFLYGNAQANRFDGGGSPDFIYGRGGNDILRGGGGFDFLFGGAGNDVMYGQWHTDTIYGDDGDDRMWGGSNFVTREYPGTNYADVLYGGAGNDRLHGDAPRPREGRTAEYIPDLDLGAGRDELHGGIGNDILNGDGGDDTLWGDAGADIFRFDPTHNVLVRYSTGELGYYKVEPSNDVIKDFSGPSGDRVDLSQPHTVGADGSGSTVIRLLDPANRALQQGSVTLEGVALSSFNPSWII